MTFVYAKVRPRSVDERARERKGGEEEDGMG